MGVRPDDGENHQMKTDMGIQNALCDSQAFNNAIATFHVGGWMNPFCFEWFGSQTGIYLFPPKLT